MKEILYNVYGVKDGRKELVGTFREPADAHEAAMRWTMMFQAMQIEKVSKPKEKV